MKNPLEELTQYFIKFPGIGRRQAKRFAYFIIQSDASWVQNFTHSIEEAHRTMKLDPTSFQYFYSTDPLVTHAPLSRDPRRDQGLLMIVEKDIDIEAIEKAHVYHGLYFVLGGLAPLIHSDLEKVLRVRPLIERIAQRAQDPEQPLREVILAFSAHPEGDRTALLLKEYLEKNFPHHTFTISQLGRGFSTGTEVEYSDPDTLASALKGRYELTP